MTRPRFPTRVAAITVVLVWLLAARVWANIDSTTSAQLVLPSAAVGVSVTPSGTNWGNSGWVQLTASTPTAIVATGVEVNASADNENNVNYEVDIGTGGSGSEVVVGTVIGHHSTSGQEAHAIWLKFPVPIDNIATSTRVAVRLRKAGTNANTWTFAMTYLAKPVGGTVSVTSAVSKAVPSAADPLALTAATSWVSSPWAQVTASTSAAWVIGAVCTSPGSTGEQFELDIGTGGSGSEVVITTVRGGMTGVSSNQTVLLWPLLNNIGSGVRVAVRGRTSTGDALNVKLLYYDAAIPAATTTTSAQVVVPAASNGTALAPAGASFASGAWTQFIASTASAITITGLLVGNNTSANREFDIGVGGSGSEVVATTFLMTTSGSVLSTPYVNLPVGLTVASGTRVSIRLRSTNNSEAPAVCLTYVGSDPTQQSTKPQQTWSGSAGAFVSIAGNASAFANSAWAQLTPSVSQSVVVTGLTYVEGAFNLEVEVDIGTGGSGSEVVLTTFRAYVGNANGSFGTCYIPLPIPTTVPSGSRVAVRFRKSGTDTTAWLFGATYIGTGSIFPFPQIIRP